MIKTFLTRPTWGEILLTAAFSGLFALTALAQDSSPVVTRGIGPAPVNTKQHQILSGALSPQTRQVLQEAMNTARASDTEHPAPAAK
jgi:hypothetical protein